MQSNKPVAVVMGVGPGLGAALVRRFAPAYAVAMLAKFVPSRNDDLCTTSISEHERHQHAYCRARSRAG